MARKLDGRGGADPDLNELGRRQAAAAAGAVRAFLGDGPVRVVSSSLARAVQTGSVVASAMGVELETDDDWDEQGFGDWDGKSIGLLTARYPDELARLRDDDTYARAGGESHRDMAKRVLAAMERASGSGTPVVVATHRKPIMVVLAHVLGIPHDRIWRLATSPASLTDDRGLVRRGRHGRRSSTTPATFADPGRSTVPVGEPVPGRATRCETLSAWTNASPTAYSPDRTTGPSASA